MKSITADTSDQAQQRYIANIRAMSPTDRLTAAVDLSQRALAQALWVIRQRHPQVDAHEARLVLLGRLYGQEAADRVRLWATPGTESTMQGNLYDALNPVIDVLERLDVGHYIGGSVASITYGVPRSTMDVDIALQLTRRDIGAFVASLTAHYYIDGESVREAVSNQSSFNLIPLRGAVKLDLFVPERSPFMQSVFERVRYVPLAPDASRPYCLPSAEDIILLKLRWYALGNRTSSTQRGDVIGVLQTQAELLDLAYLRRWAAFLKLSDLLAQMCADAGLAV
ncbi:MAG: hypothetical protein EI684_18710 [Candidatus Viridilinea halotolerans]|uniref:Nucleotidyltransferase family protein n=1 Tax=Candidatus Viridilinea halotolerans TaxID=2491704 RepID=A0A426TT95_9CHLR|nr:MAG: hypothetical protein EI684_18710 [Candidatus Viridilinea halotolerans]